MLKFFKSHQLFFILLLIMTLCYFVTLNSYPLLSPDETRYSEIARELLAQGQYITPTLNNMIFFDKPILYYWLSIIAFKLFGIHPFATRFFPTVFAIITLIATYFFTYHIRNKHTALLAFVILGTAPLFWGGAHYSNMDMEVAALITLSLYSFYIGINNKKSGFIYASYLLAGLAFLTKGLIGIVFPMMIIGLWIMIGNQWQLLKKMKIFSGLALFFLVVSPWFYMVQKQNAGFFHFFFVVQQTQRYLTNHFNSQHHFWFYPAVILVGIIPWTYWTIQAFIQMIQVGIRQRKGLESYLLCWFFSVLIFFSIPTSKLIGYILPLFAPLAIIIALYLAERWKDREKLITKLLIFVTIGQMALLSLLLLVCVKPYIEKQHLLPIANAINPLLKENKNIKLVNFYTYFYELSFYTGEQIYTVADWKKPELIDADNWKGRFLFAVKYHPEQAKYLLLPQMLQSMCENKTPMIVVLPKKYLSFYPCHDYELIIEKNGYLALGENIK